MQLKDLDNKKIAILGLGAENYAVLKFLFGKVKGAQITVCDKRSNQELGDKYKELTKKVSWNLGATFNKKLYQYDILFRSPGWPLDCPGIKEAIARTNADLTRTHAERAARTMLYSPIRLFFDLCPTKKIIGVTGTKGKGTTASLIYEIIRQAGKRVWLGGNIGIAPFEFIKKIKDNDWAVLELSSFQLEDLETSPRIAVITNFYREHLASADPNNPNFHSSLLKYRNAKLNILKWQKAGDLAVLNRRFGGKIGRRRSKSQLLYFTKSTLQSRLPGEHNRENIAAAETVARLMNIKPAVIAKAVANFKGLEHRLEMVREIKGVHPHTRSVYSKNQGGISSRASGLPSPRLSSRNSGVGVKYYNDSFATTPESTIIAIKSFKPPIVLLAGGADKGANFRSMAQAIKTRVKFTVLFKGLATPRIEKELRRVGYPKSQVKVVADIKNAVKLARKKIGKTGIVLMSPACASFGMFKNYKERGALFKREVKKIT